MKTPESYEKQEIDAFLKKLGPQRVWFFKPYMMAYGKNGVPDYCLCLAGAFWGVEVKRPGKEPTPIQYRRIKEIENAGGHAVAGTAETIIHELREWLVVRGVVV